MTEANITGERQEKAKRHRDNRMKMQYAVNRYTARPSDEAFAVVEEAIAQVGFDREEIREWLAEDQERSEREAEQAQASPQQPYPNLVGAAEKKASAEEIEEARLAAREETEEDEGDEPDDEPDEDEDED